MRAVSGEGQTISSEFTLHLFELFSCVRLAAQGFEHGGIEEGVVVHAGKIDENIAIIVLERVDLMESKECLINGVLRDNPSVVPVHYVEQDWAVFLPISQG